MWALIPTFQFYDSPIKSKDKIKNELDKLEGFNSMIVRLKEQLAQDFQPHFYGFNSMIVRLKGFRCAHLHAS